MALRSRNDGISLLEVMIATAVLGFGLLTASLGQLAAIKNSRGSHSHTEAMYLAEQQLEIFHAMPAADVIAATTDPDYPDDPNNPIDPDPGDTDSTTYERRWFITQNSPEAGAISIRIEVDYMDRAGTTRTTTLRSLKAEL